MKNVRDAQKKTCLIFSSYEFTKILQQLISEDVEVDYSLDGITIDYKDETRKLEEEDICNVLADYFDVKKVTSIHLDDCDEPGVWVVYKD